MMRVTERANARRAGRKDTEAARLAIRVRNALLNDVSMRRGRANAGGKRWRAALGPPTRDEQREAIARHKAKCRMPGMRLAPRMRGEWSEEIRADSECRRCATRQKGSRRWWEQGGIAHTGRPARSSRARRCAAQGSPSGSATKRYESATTHSPLPPSPCESGYRKIRVACRDGTMVRLRGHVPARPIVVLSSSPRGPS